MNRSLRGLFFWIVVSFARPAQGQPRVEPVTSESLSQEGTALRREGRDAEALAVFARALAIDASPRTLAQVALAEQALGLWVQADQTLRRALASGGDAWFSNHHDTLRAALDAIGAHLASLRVDANVPGAELWIDGTRAGALPLDSPVSVAAGALALEVRAEGFESETRSIHAEPQSEAHETFTLVKQPSPAVLTLAPFVARDVPPPPTGTLAATGAPMGDAGEGTRTGAWISLGSAVVLGAGAGVAALIRNMNAADYNDDARCYYGTFTRDQRCGSYRDAASSAQTVAIVEAGGALAAAILSTVLFVRASHVRRIRIGIEGCFLGLGVACTGAFCGSPREVAPGARIGSPPFAGA